MESFCGKDNSTFWNPNESLHSHSPDLSPCFQMSVLVWVPCLYLWISCPFYCAYLHRHKRGYIRMTLLCRAKLLCAVLLWLLAWLDVSLALWEWSHGHRQGLIYFISPLLQGITMLLALLLVQRERLCGLRSSGLLFVFWLLLLLCCLPALRSKAMRAQDAGYVQDPLRLATLSTHGLLVLLQLILSTVPDRLPFFTPYSANTNPCPESNAPFLSQVTFWWFTRMSVLGFRRPLLQSDLWSLDAAHAARTLAPLLQRHWAREQRRLRHGRGRHGGGGGGGGGLAATSTTTPAGTASASAREEEEEEATMMMMKKEEEEVVARAGSSAEASVRAPRGPSLWRALCRCFGGYFLVGSFLKLFQDLLQFIGPMVLSLLIRLVESPETPSWQGYSLAVLLLVSACVQSLVLQQHMHVCTVTGIRTRSALTALVYNKSLVMSNAAKKSSTVGEIVNLVAVDAQKFNELPIYLNMLWSSPFQIVLAMYFLWQTLGPSVMAGVAIMILLIPVNGFIAVKTRSLQTEQMKLKDRRVKLMNEMLGGIKVLKLYAWELSFQAQVLEIRKQELSTLRKMAFLSALSIFCWACAPFLVALTTFGVYVSVDARNVLSAEKAFVSLSLFNILRFPLNLLPLVISNLVQASVSLKRLQAFLSHEELDPSNVERNNVEPGVSISITNGTFKWDRCDAPVLHNIALRVPEGSLVAVVGDVGSGKSSLISAILGEMELVEGRVSVRGSVAYVPQQAWIQSGTVRSNVLFGRDMDEARYRHVLDTCALLPDLELLAGGDETEIGEKGINLSGGQRQRVSLARAAYGAQSASLLLLDDPLSAVDAHVGSSLFRRVVAHGGLLHGKTRVLVTHAVGVLPSVDLIVVLSGGRVTECGSHSELLARDGAFAEFLRRHGQEPTAAPDNDSATNATTASTTTATTATTATTTGATTGATTATTTGATTGATTATGATTGASAPPDVRSLKSQTSSGGRSDNEVGEEVKERLVQDEKMETGRVSLAVYQQYGRAVGAPLALCVALLYALQGAATVGQGVWLSDWTGDAVVNGTQGGTGPRLAVYAALGFTQGLMVLLYIVLGRGVGMLRASKRLHADALIRVLRSPARFFEATPTGRLLNRFGRDVDSLDTLVPENLDAWLRCFCYTLATLMIISIATPTFLLAATPLAIAYWFIQRYYVATSRQLKRLESVSRSPVLSHLADTVLGRAVVRAHGQQWRFASDNARHIDANQRPTFAGIVSNRWLAVRLEILANLIVFFATLFAVVSRHSLSPGIVGLSVSYALQVTLTLNWLVRMTSELETNIVAVERLKEYSDLPTEAAWEIAATRPPATWPHCGDLEFVDYSLRYRDGLELALNQLTFSVRGGEKVGIVGRTGAGKSSLTLGLFRIVEPASGLIRIDGVDIARLGLTELRSRLTIIPQEPVLFAGSLRWNLDPFGRHEDAELWQVLRMAHLEDFVQQLAGGLDHTCCEGGENLSVGQRQLVCLARALLRRTRVIVLDEATAAVDLSTDALIQASIRSHFAQCTVLTIAHRLHTVIDYDRLLVLDAGRIVEYDSPQALLERRGVFYSLAKEAGVL
ncbi:multidrug resistance-associated protein 1 isoform X2 [Petromyzon marinus]|uniref:multidrug resistance-associated protein 1 isoform X2 n=1 Tax=Petromyzon marinus TaxID=7757 RepID=UPI003F6EE1E8